LRHCCTASLIAITESCHIDVHMQPAFPHDFEFLLFDGFSNMVLSCAMEPLRDARLRAGRNRANWVVSTLNGKPVESSSGLKIKPDKAFQPDAPAKRLVLVAGYGVREIADASLQAALRKSAKHCALTIALDAAPWLLAEAGLLDGQKAAIHWQEFDDFQETFPNVDVVTASFVRSGQFYTCGGANTVLALMFEMLSDMFGPVTAREASSMFLSSRADRPLSLDDTAGFAQPGSLHLLAALRVISENVETPLSNSALADRIGVSQRTLNRVFLKELQMTPGKYATYFRLRQAHYLAQSTPLTLDKIALRCGFSTAPSLCRAYKDAFGHTLRANVN